MTKKRVFFAAIVAAIMFTTILGNNTVLQVCAEDDLKTAKSCTFVIPSEFKPCETRGLFINKNRPMESSSIQFSYYDNGKDVVLTNRERLAEEASGEAKIIDDSLNMTKEIYQETFQSAYTATYGRDVSYTVTSFENITIDGYPGYRADATFQVPGGQLVYQTVYVICSKYRMFTITYQRADDDDCASSFETSASTIHVY